MRKMMMGAAAAALTFAAISAASAQNRLPRECRQQIVQLCGMDREQIRPCLREKYTELSETCQGELRQRMQQRREQGGRNGDGETGGLRSGQHTPADAPEDD